jgi:hypothetical protein
VNLGMVQKCIDAGKLDAKAVIDHAALKAAGLARGGKDGVRLLGKGELTAKVSFKVAGVGRRAALRSKAGGSVELPRRQPSEHEKKPPAAANKAAKAASPPPAPRAQSDPAFAGVRHLRRVPMMEPITRRLVPVSKQGSGEVTQWHHAPTISPAT